MLDTRELGRRPGSQREVSRTVPAPADLGIEVLRVPEGSPVELDLRLEAVMEGVLVTGTAHGRARGRVRAVPGADLRRDRGRGSRSCSSTTTSDHRHGSDAEDDEVSRLEDDLLDLEPLLRDAVVLALPFQPLCQDDCPGLCTECGARLADDPDHAHDAPIDPRWASAGRARSRTTE